MTADQEVVEDEVGDVLTEPLTDDQVVAEMLTCEKPAQ